MGRVGGRDTQYAALIPARHHKAHDFCFFIHDQLARALVEYELAGVHTQVQDAFLREATKNGFELHSLDLVELLKKDELRPLYEKHLLGHLVLGLTSDMCHFLYEALTCFEKRKFSVGYSLLRKPLKENLLFLCWILGGLEDFIGRFEKDNYRTLNNLAKEKQIAIISAAIERLATADAFDVNVLWELIYSKNSDRGLEPLWQQATHLITSKGDLLKTPDYSINFVFNDVTRDELFDRLYEALPYVLTFCMQIVIECFSKMQRLNQNTYSHLLITTLGCYEALFLKGRSPIASMLNKSMGELLKCCHCSAHVRITKRNAVSVFLSEQADCPSCGVATPMPMYWLFAAAKLKVSGAEQSVEGPL